MAKSTMFGNFCVAGIDMNSGEWVRFVAFETGDPLADYELIFVNEIGGCEPLDAARIGIARRVPRRNHTEDCMIKRMAWLKLGRMNLDDVFKIHPPENHQHQFVFGTPRNYIDEFEMRELNLKYSLTLVSVENLKIIFSENVHGIIRGKACFSYNGVDYDDVRVTDPAYETVLPFMKNFSIKIPAACLVMSMPSKPLQVKETGRYYKLIAKIFPIS